MANLSTWEKMFGWRDMQHMISYLVSANLSSQTLAEDGTNHENIQTSGGALCQIAGTMFAAAADAECDISAEHAYAAWAASTSYTTAGIVSEVTHADENGTTRHYVCILAHTSAAADEPATGANWRTYWRQLNVYATEAVGDVIATATTRYYLACIVADGTLRLFKAYDSTGAVQIPAFDPERYAAVGLITVANASGSNFTVGTTAFNTASVTTTYSQIIGPIFPASSLLDQN